MHARQVSRIQHLTNLVNRYYGTGDRTTKARVSFTVEAMGEDGTVMLSASNLNDLPWYETGYHAHFVIGKQGGVAHYIGNMSPKLVMNVPPRRCDYSDPFKQAK